MQHANRLQTLEQAEAMLHVVILGAMMKTTKELLEQAKQLPLDERAELVDALLETIDASDPDRDREWSDEAQSRLRAYRSGELSATDADEVINSKRP